MLRKSRCVFGAGVVALSVSNVAMAQDEPPAPEASEPMTVAEEKEAEEAEAVEDALDTGATEVEGKQYMFVGARYRNVIVPKFIQNAFADGGETLFAHTPGVEFVIRQDQFEYELFAMLGFYSFEDVPFKGATDPDTAWEILDGDYKILYLGSDFMWSTDDFVPGLSLMYGAGAGLGFVFGDLTRTQSYPPDGVTDPYSYVRCVDVGQGQPNVAGQATEYCGDDNNHYNGFVEPSWTDGGSSPLFFPWIAAQLGLRYKLNRQFVTRLDLGVMVTGAFLGVGADFGL